MLGSTSTPDVLLVEARWYAVRTRSRCEARVERQAREVAEETFLPLLERERQWSDRKKTVPFPLFAGYLFVRLNLQRIGQLLAVPGLVGVVSPSG